MKRRRTLGKRPADEIEIDDAKRFSGPFRMQDVAVGRRNIDLDGSGHLRTAQQRMPPGPRGSLVELSPLNGISVLSIASGKLGGFKDR